MPKSQIVESVALENENLDAQHMKRTAVGHSRADSETVVSRLGARPQSHGFHLSVKRRRRSFGERWSRRVVLFLLKLAVKCLRRRRPNYALLILRPLMDAMPTFTLVRVLLARAAIANFDPLTAMKAVHPRHNTGSCDEARHYGRLARLNIQLGNTTAAARYAQLAFDVNPKSARAWEQIGQLHMHEHDIEGAVACFQQQAEFANTITQKHLAVLAAATALASTGQREKAAAEFRAAIQISPKSEAYFGLVDAQNDVDADHPVIESIRKLLTDSSIADKSHLHFAMAIAHERSSNIGEAFSHFVAGNMISATAFQHAYFNPKEDFVRRREFFTKSVITNLSQHGIRDDFLICIVGMPRSGTTLMEQIISSHSRVTGLGERTDFFDLAQRLGHRLRHKKGYPSCCKHLSGVMINQEAHFIHEQMIGQLENRPYAATKRPGDVWELGLIKILFPKAKIIHMTRDPVDTCWSCFMQNFHQVPYASNLKALVTEYKNYREMVRHWKEVLPEDSIIDVSYERLVAESEATIRATLDFCGLNYEVDCLQFHRDVRPVFTASHYQVREPIYTTSVRRSDPYRDYLAGTLLELENDPEFLDKTA